MLIIHVVCVDAPALQQWELSRYNRDHLPAMLYLLSGPSERFASPNLAYIDWHNQNEKRTQITYKTWFYISDRTLGKLP